MTNHDDNALGLAFTDAHRSAIDAAVERRAAAVEMITLIEPLPFMDYEVLRSADDSGYMYLSDNRCASYMFVVTILGAEVVLNHTVDGKQITMVGMCQYDKAHDVCRIWVEEGRISQNFKRIGSNDSAGS